MNLEREAGRVFSGFKEGRIVFAPTYKYSQNSDSYAGETVKSKKKRRTPAWYFPFCLLLFQQFLFDFCTSSTRILYSLSNQTSVISVIGEAAKDPNRGRLLDKP